MAESKKITELHNIPSLSEEDEFVVVDKSTTEGADAAATGKTSKATVQQLRDGMFPNGAPAGEKGEKGPQGGTGQTGIKGQQGPSGTSIAGPQG